jgi:Gpi18-like mannosyltransferase
MRSTGKLSLILLGAFLFRLLFIGFDGFHNDVQTFEAWTLTLRDHPFESFYVRAGFADYPPGYLYVLALLAKLYASIGGTDHSYQLLHALVKLPGIIFDLFNAGLVYALARGFISERGALGAAAVTAFNPAFIFISAYWGQVDSVAATFVLISLLALDRALRGTLHPLLAGIAMWLSLAASILIKPTALLLAPLLCLWPVAARRGWARVILASIAGVFAALILSYLLARPFAPGQSPLAVTQWLLERYRFGSNVYPYNSINAFNLYAIAQPFWEPDSTHQLLTFGLKQSTWSIALVVAVAFACAARFAVLATPLAALEAAALTLFGFFLFATRMHERYLFDAVLLLMPLGAILPRYRSAAILTTVTLFCNLLYSLDYLSVMTHATPSADPRNLMPWLSRPCAFLNTVTFVYFALAYLGVIEPAELRIGANALSPIGTDALTRIRGWYNRWIRLPNTNEGQTGLTRTDLWLSLGFTLLSFLICIIGYAHPAERIFDEIYYARSGEEYLKHIEQFEWTHPPLTKLIITFSMLLFGGLHGGDSAAGWRALNVVIGALMVGVLYLFTKRLSGSSLCAGAAAGFLLLDGFHFAQSRIATPEITVAFFSLLTLAAFYRFWMSSEQNPETRRPLSTRLLVAYGVAGLIAIGAGWALSLQAGTKPGTLLPEWLPSAVLILFYGAGAYTFVRCAASARSVETNRLLLALTLSAGCLAASKWNGLFDLFVIWVCAAAACCSRWIPRLRFLGDDRVLPLDLLLSSLLFGGGVIYLLTYIPYFSLGHTFFDLLTLQHSMYAYHADLRATHPYSSVWWQWPLLQRPISYYYHDFRTGAQAGRDTACCVAEILALPNPLLWWLGLIAVPATALIGWIEKRRGYLLLALAYLFQWLPWIASPRIAFEYHFFPNLAIICCCDALILHRLWLSGGQVPWFRSWQRISCVGVALGALAAFVYWYPIFSGTGMTYAQWNQRVLTWVTFLHWI